MHPIFVSGLIHPVTLHRTLVYTKYLAAPSIQYAIVVVAYFHVMCTSLHQTDSLGSYHAMVDVIPLVGWWERHAPDGSLHIHPCRAWHAEPWCEEGIVRKAVARISEGQATSCQRLLSVATEHLATLQRWNK